MFGEPGPNDAVSSGRRRFRHRKCASDTFAFAASALLDDFSLSMPQPLAVGPLAVQNANRSTTIGEAANPPGGNLGSELGPADLLEMLRDLDEDDLEIDVGLLEDLDVEGEADEEHAIMLPTTIEGVDCEMGIAAPVPDVCTSHAPGTTLNLSLLTTTAATTPANTPPPASLRPAITTAPLLLQQQQQTCSVSSTLHGPTSGGGGGRHQRGLGASFSTGTTAAAPPLPPPPPAAAAAAASLAGPRHIRSPSDPLVCLSSAVQLPAEKPLSEFAGQTRANAFDPRQLDPKRAKRIIANRQSAHRSRMRKLEAIRDLELQMAAEHAAAEAVRQQVTAAAVARRELLAEALEVHRMVSEFQRKMGLATAEQAALLSKLQGLSLVTAVTAAPAVTVAEAGLGPGGGGDGGPVPGGALAAAVRGGIAVAALPPPHPSPAITASACGQKSAAAAAVVAALGNRGSGGGGGNTTLPYLAAPPVVSPPGLLAASGAELSEASGRSGPLLLFDEPSKLLDVQQSPLLAPALGTPLEHAASTASSVKGTTAAATAGASPSAGIFHQRLQCSGERSPLLSHSAAAAGPSIAANAAANATGTISIGSKPQSPSRQPASSSFVFPMPSSQPPPPPQNYHYQRQQQQHHPPALLLEGPRLPLVSRIEEQQQQWLLPGASFAHVHLPNQRRPSHHRRHMSAGCAGEAAGAAAAATTFSQSTGYSGGGSASASCREFLGSTGQPLGSSARTTAATAATATASCGTTLSGAAQEAAEAPDQHPPVRLVGGGGPSHHMRERPSCSSAHTLLPSGATAVAANAFTRLVSSASPAAPGAAAADVTAAIATAARFLSPACLLRTTCSGGGHQTELSGTGPEETTTVEAAATATEGVSCRGGDVAIDAPGSPMALDGDLLMGFESGEDEGLHETATTTMMVTTEDVEDFLVKGEPGAGVADLGLGFGCGGDGGGDGMDVLMAHGA